MIKRTVEISAQPAHVSIRNSQIQLHRDKTLVGSIPVEDLGILVVDHPQTTFSAAALARIAEKGGAVVFCDRSHLPVAMLMPNTRHTELLWRLTDQIESNLPVKKRLWQQVVNAKIHAQAELLTPKSRPHRKLKALATQVKSGDTGAAESQAARVYWANWLTSHLPETDPNAEIAGLQPGYDRPYIAPRIPNDTSRTETYDDDPELFLPELGETPGQQGQPLSEDELRTTARQFRRDPDEGGLNAFLNYGYAIVRACTARALVGAGLNPALGIQHANRGNPFCLADDLMEPLRPLVDRRVRRLWCEEGRRTLDPRTKAVLLEVLTETVKYDGETGPLMVVMSRYVNSFLRCLTTKDQKLITPKMLP